MAMLACRRDEVAAQIMVTHTEREHVDAMIFDWEILMAAEWRLTVNAA